MTTPEELIEERLRWARKVIALEEEIARCKQLIHHQTQWLAAYRDYVRWTFTPEDVESDDIVREFWKNKGYGLP